MNELIEKYKYQKFEFSSYYKYSFWYENKKAKVRVGGDHDDIYRADLGRVMTLRQLLNECGEEYLEIIELSPSSEKGKDD